MPAASKSRSAREIDSGLDSGREVFDYFNQIATKLIFGF